MSKGGAKSAADADTPSGQIWDALARGDRAPLLDLLVRSFPATEPSVIWHKFALVFALIYPSRRRGCPRSLRHEVDRLRRTFADFVEALHPAPASLRYVYAVVTWDPSDATLLESAWLLEDEANMTRLLEPGGTWSYGACWRAVMPLLDEVRAQGRLISHAF